MRKLTALLVCLALLAALGAPAALTSGEELEPMTISMLVPENDPAGLPFQLGDILSGKIEHPVWEIFNSWLEEKSLTIEFDLVANSQYEVVAQTRLASDVDLADIINVRPISISQLTSYANLGMLLPVSDIINDLCAPETLQTIEEKYPFYFGMTANPADGKSYWFGQLDAYTIDGEPGSFTIELKIRHDWIQDLELTMPTSIYDLLTLGAAFHEQDANKNGVIGDEVFFAEPNFSVFGDAFGLVRGPLTGMVNDGNNVVVSPWYQEGVVDYFRFLQDMYAAGLLDLSVGVVQLNAEDRLAGQYQYAYQQHMEPACPDPDCFFAPVGVLTGVEGIEPVYRMDSVELYNAGISFAVTKECDQPEGVARLLDILFTEEFEDLTIGGIEGLNYTLIEGNGDRPVMNTNINWIVPDSSADAMREAGLSNGYRIWGKGIFPRIITVGVESDFILGKIDDYEAEGDWQNVMRYQAQYESYSRKLTATEQEDNLYAIPTDEEADRKNELATDLNTYVEELIPNLIIGTASLDNWDSYIDDLKALGLDELIEINQTLADRRVGA